MSDLDERKDALPDMPLHVTQEVTCQNVLLQQSIDAMPSPVFHKDTRGLYTGCNGAFEAFFGKGRDDIIGKTVFDLAPAEIARKHHDADLKLMGSPGTLEYEAKFMYADGTVHDVHVSKATYNGPDGSPGGIVGIMTDITERKQAEEENRLNEARLQSLYNLSQYDSKEQESFLEYSLNEAMRLTGSKLGYISHYNEDSGVLAMDTWSREAMEMCGIEGRRNVYQLQDTGIWGEVVRQRKALIINDFEAPHPLKKGYPEGHCQIERFLSVPVIVEDRIVGVVGVANKEIDYNETDVRQLSLHMDSVWKIVLRKESEDRVRASGKMLTDIIDFLPDATFAIDTEGRVIFWNRAVEEMTGVKAEAVLDKGNFEHSLAFYGERRPLLLDLLMNPDAAIETRYTLFARAGDELMAEVWAPIRDGELRYLRGNASLIRSASGEVIGAIESLQDLTERKIDQDKLEGSELRYRTLFDSAGDAIFIIDENGDFFDVNKVACDRLGYTRQELLTMNFADINVENDTAKIRENIEKLRREGKATLETKHRASNGRIIPVEVNIRTIELSGKKYILDIARDITERKASELALRKEEEKYRTLFENVSDLVYFHDLEGNYNLNECNFSMNRIFRSFMDQTLTMNLRDILPVNARGGFDEYLVRILEKGSDSGIMKVRDREGASHYFEYWNFLVRDEAGPYGVRGFAREISDRIRSERALHEKNCSLEEMKARLEEYNKDLMKAYTDLKDAHSRIIQAEKMATIGQLAAGVAHEINNPIGFITSNLGSLRKYLDKISRYVEAIDQATPGCADAVRAEILEKRTSLKIDFILEDIRDLISESLDGADRVKKIVLDLKSFSRLDEPELAMADINASLESTLNIVWNELKYKTEVVKEYGELSPTLCYPQQLNQVFMNILVNAAQSIEKRGQIKVKTWEESGMIHVSISDTGSGIPEEHMQKLFEPFFTTKAPGKGTGLGLSIAFDIIKRHDGEIQVQSTVGTGTTFIIRLPVKGEQP